MSKKSIQNLLTLSNVDVLSSEQANQILGGKGRCYKKVKRKKCGSRKHHHTHCHKSSSSSSSSSSMCTPPPPPIVP